MFRPSVLFLAKNIRARLKVSTFGEVLVTIGANLRTTGRCAQNGRVDSRYRWEGK